jgi:ribosomal protein S18 acetylase RimI-like enzyme
MQFVTLGPDHFPDISRLPSSAEELKLLYSGKGFPWTIEQIQELYEQRSDFTGVLVDGTLAAFANLYNVNPGHSAFLGNIIVADAFKGRGIGRLLTEYMTELVKVKYDAEPHLTVYGFNARALLLYARMGYKPYDVAERRNLKDEVVAVVHMRQPLS